MTFGITKRLPVASSIHWHGIILLFRMDGVPGISFDGIASGQTFTYRIRGSMAPIPRDPLGVAAAGRGRGVGISPPGLVQIL